MYVALHRTKACITGQAPEEMVPRRIWRTARETNHEHETELEVTASRPRLSPSWIGCRVADFGENRDYYIWKLVLCLLYTVPRLLFTIVIECAAPRCAGLPRYLPVELARV